MFQLICSGDILAAAAHELLAHELLAAAAISDSAARAALTAHGHCTRAADSGSDASLTATAKLHMTCTRWKTAAVVNSQNIAFRTILRLYAKRHGTWRVSRRCRIAPLWDDRAGGIVVAPWPA